MATDPVQTINPAIKSCLSGTELPDIRHSTSVEIGHVRSMHTNSTHLLADDVKIEENGKEKEL